MNGRAYKMLHVESSNWKSRNNSRTWREIWKLAIRLYEPVQKNLCREDISDCLLDLSKLQEKQVHVVCILQDDRRNLFALSTSNVYLLKLAREE